MMLFAFVLVMVFLFAAIALFSSRCLRSRSPMQLKSSHRQSKSDNGRTRTKRVGAFVAVDYLCGTGLGLRDTLTAATKIALSCRTVRLDPSG